VFRTECTREFSKLFCSLSEEWVSGSLRSWEEEGSEEEGWQPTPVRPLLVQVGSLPATSPDDKLNYDFGGQ